MESITEHETRRQRRARFEGLAHVVTEPLHRYLLRRTAPDMVEDVLSETMLVLWRRVDHVPGLRNGSLPDRDEVLPWCYGVARGCLANARRAHGRRLRLVERLMSVQQAPVSQAPVLVITDHSDLHAALDALGELDREVIRLWAKERSVNDNELLTLLRDADPALTSRAPLPDINRLVEAAMKNDSVATSENTDFDTTNPTARITAGRGASISSGSRLLPRCSSAVVSPRESRRIPETATGP